MEICSDLLSRSAPVYSSQYSLTSSPSEVSIHSGLIVETYLPAVFHYRWKISPARSDPFMPGCQTYRTFPDLFHALSHFTLGPIRFCSIETFFTAEQSGFQTYRGNLLMRPRWRVGGAGGYRFRLATATMVWSAVLPVYIGKSADHLTLARPVPRYPSFPGRPRRLARTAV